MIDGGCQRCGKLTQLILEPEQRNNKVDLICDNCYNKYYSDAAIREAKLKKLLKKSLWYKLKQLIKPK